MADYRTIHNKIWDDTWFHELSADAKLLWFYLITNRRGSVAGIYELPMWVIQGETGLERESIETGLEGFVRDRKIEYDGQIMWVINMRRYQCTTSQDLLTRVQRDLDLLPDRPIKARYIEYHTTGTLPTPCIDRPDTRARARSEPNRTEPNRTEPNPDRTEPKRTRKARQSAKPPAPGIHLLIGAYSDAYLARYKRRPTIFGGKDGQFFKTLLTDHSPEELTAAINLFLDSDDPWIIQCGHSLSAFRSRLDGLLNELATDTSVADNIEKDVARTAAYLKEQEKYARPKRSDTATES